jgi:hypothetical protein
VFHFALSTQTVLRVRQDSKRLSIFSNYYVVRKYEAWAAPVRGEIPVPSGNLFLITQILLSSDIPVSPQSRMKITRRNLWITLYYRFPLLIRLGKRYQSPQRTFTRQLRIDKVRNHHINSSKEGTCGPGIFSVELYILLCWQY